MRDLVKSWRLSAGLLASGTALRDTLFGFRVPTGPGDGLMDTRAPRPRCPWIAWLRADAGGPEEAKPRLVPRLSVVFLFAVIGYE